SRPPGRGGSDEPRGRRPAFPVPAYREQSPPARLHQAPDQLPCRARAVREQRRRGLAAPKTWLGRVMQDRIDPATMHPAPPIDPESRSGRPMPMIDVYAADGTFADKHALARKLAEAVRRWEQVPAIPLFLDNTAAFIHDLPADAISNAAG